MTSLLRVIDRNTAWLPAGLKIHMAASKIEVDARPGECRATVFLMVLASVWLEISMSKVLYKLVVEHFTKACLLLYPKLCPTFGFV